MLQQALFPIERAVVAVSDSPKEKRGVVFTKPWVVDLILDFVGYCPEGRLFDRLLVEPSAGDGSFLVPVVQRLVESCRLHGVFLTECRDSLRAFELDPKSANSARAVVRAALEELSIRAADAELLADSWIRCADYLLESSDLIGKCHWVVGNPPYIRLEDLENGGAEYRKNYPTMVGRADIYVAFYEAALRHLATDGVCSFICADRWMLNQYGTELRRLVTSRFAVEAVVQMHHADAFESEVSAYPAVVVIRKGRQGSAVIAQFEPEIERAGGANIAAHLKSTLETGDNGSVPGLIASRVESWFQGGDPWPLIDPARLKLLKRLESGFPTLEQTGCIVGIGVATGADNVFVTTNPQLVEPERLLPLAMAADLRGGSVQWSGHYLVDPWQEEGLVELQSFPRLKSHLENHRAQLGSRHVGKKAAKNWYRTIDRVTHSLTSKPKLYLPDFKGRISPVLDEGKTYPHHNVYFITPGDWDAEVLGGILLSNVAQFFIEAYGVRMRGGYLRFQAQYLRRIRIPLSPGMTPEHKTGLREAFRLRDVAASNRIVQELYSLTDEEAALLGH